MKKKLLVVSAIIALFLISCSYKQVKNENFDNKNIITLLKNLNIPEDYTDIPAITIVKNFEIKVEPDLSYTKHIYLVRKVLNYEGKKKYSDVKITYNKNNEELILGECYSISPDFEKIPIPENQIIEQNDKLSISSPEYVNSMNTIINFPKVEPGYCIVLDYSIKNKSGEPVSGVEYFDGKVPSLYKKLEISFPKNMSVQYEIDGEDINFEDKSNKSVNIYQWTAKNTKVIHYESQRTRELLMNEKVVYSMYENWQALAKDKLKNFENVEISQNIKDFSNTLCENANNEEEKIVEIYKYLANNLSVKPTYISEVTFKPLSLDRIFENKYGSIIDITALFIGLAKAQGIENIYPALILQKNDRFTNLQTDYGVENFIDKFGVLWNEKLLIPGSNAYSMKYPDYKAYIISKASDYLPILYSPGEVVSAESNFEYFIRNDEAAVINVKSIASGKMESMYRMYQNYPPIKRKIMFNQQIGDKSALLIDGPDFDSFDDLSKGITVSYKVAYENFLIHQDNYIYFKIFKPYVNVNVILAERKMDLQIFEDYLAKENFHIKLENADIMGNNPELINSLDIDKKFKIGDEIAYFKLHSKLENGEIFIEREIFIPTGIVSKEEYPAFRDFILEIKNPVNSQIFIKK